MVDQRSRIGYSSGHPGDYGMLLTPKGWRGDGTVYGGIALHGATGLPMVYTDPSSSGPSSIQIAHYEVLACGRPLFCPYVQGDQFGNATATAVIDDAIAVLATIGCKAGKAFLFGESMGAGEAFSYALQHPTKVTSITGIVPMSNLLTIWQNNRAGVTASINAAAGGTYVPATHGPTMDPNVFGASLAGIPIDLWYSSNDTIVLPAEVQALAALIGPSARLNAPLTGAHGEAAISSIGRDQRNSMCDFIRQYAVAAGG